MGARVGVGRGGEREDSGLVVNRGKVGELCCICPAEFGIFYCFFSFPPALLRYDWL